MKYKFLFIVWIFGVLLNNSLGFAQWKKKDKKKSEFSQNTVSENPPIATEEDQNLYQTFVKATQKFVVKDFEKALEEYRKCEKIAPNQPAVQYKIAHCLYELRKTAEALPYIQKAIELEPSNRHYYLLKVDIHTTLGQFEQAIETFRKGIKNVPNAGEWYYEIAANYLYLGKTTEALKAYDDGEKILGIDPDIIRQKQRIYLNERKCDAAIQEGEKLINAFPGEWRYQLEHADLLMRCGETSKAEKILITLLNLDNHRSEARVTLARLYQSKQDHERYLNLLSEIADDLYIYHEDKTSLLEPLAKSTDTLLVKKVVPIAEKILNNISQNSKLHSLYADILSTLGQMDSARIHYRKSLELNPDQIHIWAKLLDINIKKEDFHSLINDAQEAIATYPNQPQFYYFSGIGYVYTKNYANAKKELEKGKKLAYGQEIETDFISQLADVYHYLGEYDKSEAAFEAILAKDPNDTHALNNYSYFLSIRNQKLDKAKTYSTRLIGLAPDNPTYLDTHGWVLYQLGLYSEAEPFLRRAAEAKTNSGVIQEHYGDVLFRLGKVEQAILFWQKAKELGGSEDPQKLERKLALRSID